MPTIGAEEDVHTAIPAHSVEGHVEAVLSNTGDQRRPAEERQLKTRISGLVRAVRDRVKIIIGDAMTYSPRVPEQEIQAILMGERRAKVGADDAEPALGAIKSEFRCLCSIPAFPIELAGQLHDLLGAIGKLRMRLKVSKQSVRIQDSSTWRFGCQ
ncbi:MAG: hypothetical protein WBF76_09125 [Pseudonocardiaceae bacterium]